MARKLFLLTTLVVLSVSLTTSSATAEPWNKILPFNKVDADPNKTYALQETDGPWLILAATFSGEGGVQQAHDLVFELRKQHNLPAYMYDKSITLDKDTGARGVDRYNRPIQWKYRRGSQHKETAVLVGHFVDPYDPKAKSTLDKIKHINPECLSVERRGKTSMNLARLREAFKTILKDGNEKKKKGPMGQAFLVQNPSCAGNESVRKTLDPFVVDLNKGVAYSLLDAKGRYTVQVAHFTGKVITKQKAIQRIESGELKLNESLLRDAAMKADKLTKALRLKGYEAYQFHDRQASIVTIGSFNSVGTPRRDGRTEINPQIHKIIQAFSGRPVPGTGKLGCQTILDIPLELQPYPVEIPRESITSSLVRRSNNDN